MHNLDFLSEQGVNESLIEAVRAFCAKYEAEGKNTARIVKPEIFFYGRDILEMAIAAILQGENILLSGPKATGKNVLAETLAYVFNRPAYNISFNVNTDSSSLIGTDTFRDNEVQLRRGPVCECALDGGFAVLDEINMAKNDAVSVLHATLDHRRIIDIPGYERISLHEATRFIGTMNYGYAGTRELNEALVSRFLVIDMPQLEEEILLTLLTRIFPQARKNALEQFAGLFMDLQKKAENGEISTKSLDLRGMIGALKTMRSGLKPILAVKMGISNKTFDIFEREIVDDVILTRIPEVWSSQDVF